MLDQSIKVEFHISFTNNGRYSDQHTRSINFEIAQVQKPTIRSELDHEYKYRFLTMDDAGNINSLYSRDQTINGGAGDLMLYFTGLSGSGTEFCDVTKQTLTRGSQYQTSFLPEMANGQTYKVKVKATYKDYLPVEFILDVQYLPNLNGKTKFVDLGTHVFFKTNPTSRPTDFKFLIRGVTDD
jgi:hypothetical protein